MEMDNNKNIKYINVDDTNSIKSNKDEVIIPDKEVEDTFKNLINKLETNKTDYKQFEVSSLYRLYFFISMNQLRLQKKQL